MEAERTIAMGSVARVAAQLSVRKVDALMAGLYLDCIGPALATVAAGATGPERRRRGA
jgi:hypothetical protein